MLAVKKAEYVGGYRIFVELNDGLKGEVDLKEQLWGEVFEPLRDEAIFRNFEISSVLKTIVWPNGADLAPEFLQDRIIEVNKGGRLFNRVYETVGAAESAESQ